MNEEAHDQLAEDVGSVPTFFREHEEFLDSLETAMASAGDPSTWTQPDVSITEAKQIRGMCKTLEAYQEQPTCLDPYLERIVSRLMTAVQGYVHVYYERQSGVRVERLNGIFDLLYTLCKVRGHKVVMRFFPHSVADVEPAFAALWWFASDLRASSWAARNTMLVWLSLLAMIPFDIESLDSGIVGLPAIESLGDAGNEGPLVSRWIELGKLFLARPGCEMESAALMLSRLLSRKDTASDYQPQFVSWAVREINGAVGGADGSDDACLKKALGIGSVLRVNGALRVICHLFSAMDTVAVLGDEAAQLQDIFQLDAFEQHSVTRKLISKAAQRLALLMLPPAPAPDTDRLRGRRDVRSNLGASANTEVLIGCGPVGRQTGSVGSDTDGDSQSVTDVEIPEDVEPLLGVLLQRLHDKDTVVRWSAAKGIGRIAERLPPALAREIVSAVGDILKDETLIGDDGVVDVSMTAEFSWHGALLCLAELSRRGLLYPQAVREVVPWVVRGLSYEVQRGDYSVGANVRDAACYVMWSFARIPNISGRRVFAEMSTEMATALISVAVFDRESNVRRAASAAFQEHVGRQLADFFSVGIMRNAFVTASRKIAEYEEYRQPLLRHLCTVTIYHWDLKTRVLAVRALRELAPLAPDYVRATLLPSIVANVSSPFLAVRHGAIAATGAIAETIASCLMADESAAKLILSVSDSVPLRYIEDFGASLALEALTSYIGSVGRAQWDIGGSGMQSKFFEIFVHALTTCKEAGGVVTEFTSFVDAYGLTSKQHASVEEATRVARSGTSCESFVLAVGALSAQHDLDLLCDNIARGATIEIRRNAAMALGHFCKRAQDDEGRGGLSSVQEHAAIDALSQGLTDHSVDNRGDVGSWVRQQSLCSLADIFGADRQVLLRLSASDEGLAIGLLGLIFRAATEKIDKLRAAAGRMVEIVLHEQQHDGIAADIGCCLDQLKQLVPEGALDRHIRYVAAAEELHWASTGDGGFSWADAGAAFARIVPALAVGEERIRQPLFEGLVATGSTEPLGRLAVNAVAEYAETRLPGLGDTAAGSGADGLVNELTRLLMTDRRTSKTINPALIVADQLAEVGALVGASQESLAALYRATQRVAFKLRAPTRLGLCLKLYSSLALASDELACRAAESLVAHMGHPILKIRQTAADHLFATACIHGAIDAGEDADELAGLLTETEWGQDSADVKAARARVVALVRGSLHPVH
ncbi:hypothetical protein GGF46_000218 [Coemansia sp. RSA 552]|nr:hypothetical protein GGF46_000218 [Coemansia sp. RSA 552]